MNNKLILIIISFCICSALSFSGCGNSNPTDPVVTTITVNGKSIDGSGNGISGITAIIGSSTAVSASDGSFTLSGVTTPYDLKLVQSTGATPIGIVYQGLTSSSPELFTPGVGVTTNSTTLAVNVPVLGINQRAILIYTDGLSVEAFGFVSPPATSGNIVVNWPGNTSFTGKVIVLVYTVGSGAITTYDKYGEKSGFVLNNGSPATTTFLAADLPINPGETTVSGSVTAPASYTSLSVSMVLTFRTQTTILSSNLLGLTSANSYSFVVPTGLTTPFKILVGGTANGPGVGSHSGKLSEVIAGSSGNSLLIDEVPVLSTPPDNSVNIDTTTNFTFSQGSGTGINLIEFNSSGTDYYIFTSATTVKIPNLSQYGVNIGSSVSYGWYVQKFSGFTTSDSFVQVPIFNGSSLNGVSTSVTRHFTSKP